MVLAELIRRFRVAAFDMEQPYLFADTDITDWLNDAVKEAAIRGRLIHESTNPAICTINTVAGVSVYPLHEALYEIDALHWISSASPERHEALYLISSEDMGAIWSDWRTRTHSTPEYAIQGDTSLRIVPAPLDAGTLHVEGYRTPIALMQDDNDRPEINIIHHEYLVLWALHKGFSVPDAETFDLNRAALAEQGFTDYFGVRPDSDLRRTTRTDTPHTVKPYWV